MTDADERSKARWAQLGRAAEQFARDIAGDARRFAGQVEKHAGKFADDVGREWSTGQGPAADLQRVFDDVRGAVATMLSGVDDLVGDLFASGGTWTRRAVEREAKCAGCGRTVAAGEEAWVRGQRSRCLACGKPGA